jgi:hypothetical protein
MKFCTKARRRTSGNSTSCDTPQLAAGRLILCAFFFIRLLSYKSVIDTARESNLSGLNKRTHFWILLSLRGFNIYWANLDLLFLFIYRILQFEVAPHGGPQRDTDRTLLAIFSQLCDWFKKNELAIIVPSTRLFR